MVVLKHATESLTASDVAIIVSSIFARFNQLISESVMVAFSMIVLHVFTHGVLQ